MYIKYKLYFACGYWTLDGNHLGFNGDNLGWKNINRFQDQVTARNYLALLVKDRKKHYFFDDKGNEIES